MYGAMCIFLLGFGFDFNPSALSKAFSTALMVVESSVFSDVFVSDENEAGRDEDEAGCDEGEAAAPGPGVCRRSLLSVAADWESVSRPSTATTLSTSTRNVLLPAVIVRLQQQPATAETAKLIVSSIRHQQREATFARPGIMRVDAGSIRNVHLNAA